MRTVEDMNPGILLLLLLPALLTGILTAVNAKTINAQWRERRNARLAAKAAPPITASD